MQLYKTKTLSLIGLMSAVICVAGPLTVTLPFSPVPVSLANLAICLTVYILGMKNGAISCLIYLLIGLVGLPVFSGFSGGASKLLGPTGGYLIGYLFLTVIFGYAVDKWSDKTPVCIVGMALGMLVCNMFGTLWLAFQSGIGFKAALAAGVIPFIPFDIAKIFITAIIGPQIRKRLLKAGLLP